MNKVRLGYRTEDPNKQPLKQEKPAEESKDQKTAEVRYYHGKHEVEVLKKTAEGWMCKALTPFTFGDLTVEANGEFLADPRFLWKKMRKEKEAS